MTRSRLAGIICALIWLGAALYGAASAHAQPVDCRTDWGSGYSYTYCHWQDDSGVYHGTVETCYDNTGHCTIREMT